MVDVFKVAVMSQKLMEFLPVKVFNTFKGSEAHLHKKLKYFGQRFCTIDTIQCVI